MSRFLSVFLLSLLLMGCRTGKVSTTATTEVDTTHVQSVRDSVNTFSIVDKIKTDTSRYVYLIETYLYDTERTDSDGTHPLKERTSIKAVQENRITETETSKDTTEQIIETIKVDHGKSQATYKKDKTFSPRWVFLFISLSFTFLLVVVWKKRGKFW